MAQFLPFVNLPPRSLAFFVQSPIRMKLLILDCTPNMRQIVKVVCSMQEATNEQDPTAVQ